MAPTAAGPGHGNPDRGGIRLQDDRPPSGSHLRASADPHRQCGAPSTALLKGQSLRRGDFIGRWAGHLGVSKYHRTGQGIQTLSGLRRARHCA